MINNSKISKTISLIITIIFFVIIILFINYRANRILIACRQMIANKNSYEKLDRYYNIKGKIHYNNRIIVIEVDETNKNKMPNEFKWLIPRLVVIDNNSVMIKGLFLNIIVFKKDVKRSGDIKIIDGLYILESHG